MRLQLLFFVLLIGQSLDVIGQDIEKLINAKPTDLLKGKGLSIGGRFCRKTCYTGFYFSVAIRTEKDTFLDFF